MNNKEDSQELFQDYKSKEHLIVDDKDINIKKTMSMVDSDMSKLQELLEELEEIGDFGDFEDLETTELGELLALLNELQNNSKEDQLQEEIDRLKDFYNDQLDRMEEKYQEGLEEKVEELEEKLKEDDDDESFGESAFDISEEEKTEEISEGEVAGATFETEETSDKDSMISEVDELDDREVEGRLNISIEGFETEESKEKSKGLQVPDYLKTTNVIEKEPYQNYEEVDRYWLKKPYSYAIILYNEKQGDHRYYVVEPDLSKKEKFVLERTNEILKDKLLHEEFQGDHSEEKNREKLRNKTEETIRNIDVDIDKESKEKIFYYIDRDHLGYEKLDPIMNDDYVEDISCDGTDIPIFVYHKEYRNLITNVIHKDENKLRSLITKLAQMSGKHISTAEPIKSITLPDGSRGEVTLGESSDKGPTYTIRQFQDVPFTPIDLIRTGTFNTTQMAYLWLAIENKSSLIFAGGTGSGKTTSMNAISMFIPPKSKIVTIEDTREITLPHKNWVPLVTREQLNTGEGDATGIDEFELLKSALRQNPEYLVVGEIRGEEAKTLFQGMSTGHTTYSTMHAENPNEAIRRLENDPINVPREMINALDIISVQKQQRIRGDKGMKKIRRNKTIMEIKDVPEEGTANGVPVFEWNASDDTFKERLRDSIILKDIIESKGWDYDDISRDLKNRKKVLQYLIDKNIMDVEMVAKVIRTYMSEPKIVLQKIKEGSLENTKFEDITNMNIKKDAKNEKVINNE